MNHWKNYKAQLFLVVTFFYSISSLAVSTYGSKMLITGSSPYANQVGEKVAEMGGNVVDVAVAVGAAMAVTNPYNASLGGGGFAMINYKNKVYALDFREKAPKATHKLFYVDKTDDASITGGKAVGVPGFPAGLVALHEKWGRLKWKDVIKPAIYLADRGFRVGGEWVQRTDSNKKRMNAAAKQFFFKNQQKSYRPGEFMTQKKLARALRQFRYSKNEGFYKGSVAEDIVKSVNNAGGVMSMSDLADYKVRWLEPIKSKYNGYDVYTMPPPSSGGIVIKTALHLIEKMNLNKYKPLSVDELHLMSEIQSRSFRGRFLLGDPDFHQNPLNKILSNNYLRQMQNSIKKNRTSKLSPLTDQPKKESTQTTHYTVMDKDGNTVSLTTTLNTAYGSGVATERYGIALNNEMDDFTTRPGKPNFYGLIQGEGNQVEPGKRPLSSMTPTLVKKGKQTIMALGAPGGPKIISGVLQVLYRTLGNDFTMDQAIQYPRVHHQFLPHAVSVYKNHMSPDVLDLMRKRGHTINEAKWGARVNGIRRDPKTGILEAAFDSRAEGSVEGY